jgi:tetratricopeptide (TPR) repeat protein
MSHDSGSSSAARRALAAAVVLSTAVLTGCPPVQKPASTSPTTVAFSVPAFGSEPVSSGLFLSLKGSVPLSGERLLRALTPRDVIRQSVAALLPTTAPTTVPAAPESTSPPPQAIKYYLQGREKFLDGANTEAMEFLDKALQLDPNAFTVLRLMGRVCFASSQLARGALYLERAQQSHPMDVEVNYLLGRYWLERKDNDRAIAYLMQADDSPDRSAASPQMPLVSFYLARAFQAAGYHQAAAGEYVQFLQAVAVPVAEYRYDRELSYLIEEQWATHLSIAENEMLVGDFANALPYYQAAAHEQPHDAFIASRLVNAEVHLGHSAAACKTALDLAAATNGADASLQLVAWIYRNQHRDSQLVPELRTALHSSGADESATTLNLATALDDAGRSPEAFALLADHLRRQPTDLEVLAKLLKRVDSPETFAEGLAASAHALAANPAADSKILPLYLPTRDHAGSTFTPPSATDPDAPFIDYLLALAEETGQAAPSAIDARFNDSLRLRPDFLPARDAYVTWLLGQERYAKASALIQEALDKQQGDPNTWRLLVASEVAQQRLLHALQLAQQARAKYPDDPDTRLQLASIYRTRGQDAEADAELHTLLDAFPTFEPGYKALIGSLITHLQAGNPSLNDSLTTLVQLLATMNRELPNSLYAQVTTATLYARFGRLEEAEAMLRHLLDTSPDNPDVLISLAEVRQILGHPEEADTLLADSLKTHPQIRVAQALVDLYHDQGKSAAEVALAQQLVTDHPENESYALLQASIAVSEKQYDAAIVLLTAAVHHFPHSQEVAATLANVQEAAGKIDDAIHTLRTLIHDNGETPDRVYSLSHLYSVAGQDDQSVAALQQVLALMPDHTGANNDLGYFWADAGIHLDDAERMIKRAVENEPTNSAFLDSMGWLEYKQGRFADAIGWLERAVAQPDGMEAEVVQHLGDALYRAGRKPEALERWAQAQSLLSIENAPPSPAQEKLKNYLTKVLTAARAGQEPALTPTAVAPWRKPGAVGGVAGQGDKVTR